MVNQSQSDQDQSGAVSHVLPTPPQINEKSPDHAQPPPPDAELPETTPVRPARRLSVKKGQPTIDRFATKIPRRPPTPYASQDKHQSAAKRKERSSDPQAVSPSELSPDDKRSRENAYIQLKHKFSAPSMDVDSQQTDDESDQVGSSLGENWKLRKIGNPSPVRANTLPNSSPQNLHTPAAVIPPSTSSEQIEIEEIDDWAK